MASQIDPVKPVSRESSLRAAIQAAAKVTAAVPAWVLARLSRVTSSGRFITEIDGLRFVAVCSVLMFHAHGHFFEADPRLPALGFGAGALTAGLSYVIQTGWFGVQLFFIISGFILATPFAEHHLLGRPKVSLRSYFVRRLTRLEPPYIISLVLLVFLWVYLHGRTYGSLLPHFGAHLVYLHNAIYGQVSAPGFFAVNHVAWSLEVEVQFYVLAPLLCTVFAVRNRWLRRAIMVAGIVAASWLLQRFWSPMLTMTLAGQIRYFLVGFLLVDVYLCEWRSAPKKTLLWDVPGIAAWVAGPFLLSVPWAVQRLMPWVLLVAYMGAFRGRLLNRFFAAPWIAAVGGMCYTIYLYHVHLIWWTKEALAHYVFGPVRFAQMPWCFLQLLAVCAVIIAGCAVLFVLFEKPFMRRHWPRALARQLGRLFEATRGSIRGWLPARRGPGRVGQVLPPADSAAAE